MKKLAIATAAAAALLGFGSAQAYTTGTFGNGVVVPNVVHNGSTQTTAVGLIHESVNDHDNSVWWTFFDENSNHVTDGCFPMTDRDFRAFVWSAESGLGLENQRGYLVFALGDDHNGSCTTDAPYTYDGAAKSEGISANAFFVDIAANDVAFTPVLDGDLTYSATMTGLSTMDADSLVSVQGAAQTGNATFYMRYYVDHAAGGVDTRILVWSTGDHSGTHTVNMYNDEQDRKSVNFKLTNTEQDWFDPETIPGVPATYTDGFILWDANAALKDGSGATIPGSIFTYSVVTDPSFGAVQSLLGAHL